MNDYFTTHNRTAVRFTADHRSQMYFLMDLILFMEICFKIYLESTKIYMARNLKCDSKNISVWRKIKKSSSSRSLSQSASGPQVWVVPPMLRDGGLCDPEAVEVLQQVVEVSWIWVPVRPSFWLKIILVKSRIKRNYQSQPSKGHGKVVAIGR